MFGFFGRLSSQGKIGSVHFVYLITHYFQVISYYSARGGVSIIREEGARENESRQMTNSDFDSSEYSWGFIVEPLLGIPQWHYPHLKSRSTLVLKEPRMEDQGTYTCRPLQGEFRYNYKLDLAFEKVKPNNGIMNQRLEGIIRRSRIPKKDMRFQRKF